MQYTVISAIKNVLIFVIALACAAFGQSTEKPLVIKGLSIGQTKDLAMASLQKLFPDDNRFAYVQEKDARWDNDQGRAFEFPAKRYTFGINDKVNKKFVPLVTIEWDEKDLIVKISFTQDGLAEVFGSAQMSPGEFAQAIVNNYPVGRLEVFKNQNEIGWRGISNDRSTTVIIVKLAYNVGFGAFVPPSWVETLALRLEKAADTKKFD